MAVTKSDEQVRQAAREALKADCLLTGSNVDVRVHQGIVRLVGSVVNLFQKSIATDDIRRVPGVRGVKNDLVVPVKGAFDDQQVALWLRGKLIHDQRIRDQSKIQITSYEGIVTLDGIVCSKSEEQAAIEDAALTANVIDIVDDLKIQTC